MSISTKKPQRVFLYGPPGVGKTTVGAELAKRLALPFFDLDELIERETGLSISRIFDLEGEEGFRERESSQLQSWLEERQSGVLSLGGGTLLRESNRKQVEDSGMVVCLTASPEELLPRLKIKSGSRPLLAVKDSKEAMDGLMAERAEHYRLFDIHESTDQLAPEEIAERIQRRIGLYRLPGLEKDCLVSFPGNLIDELLQWLAEEDFSGSIGLVSDANVMKIYGNKISAFLEKSGFKARGFEIPAGESTKTMDTVTRLWEQFLQTGMDRNSLTLAVGGGVVSDVAGFAASTFMRGMRWAVIPTSLLAMVDASLGGKTGVDLPFGKNLAGCFYPPERVWIDPSFLATLPPVEWRCGMAETVKHAILADVELFETCREWSRKSFGNMKDDPQGFSDLIRRSSAVKIRFICKDPFERGERAALNMGHTIGHAVETASNYRVRHGEAVSIGLVLEARLSEKINLAVKGLADEISVVLAGLGLPVALPKGVDPVQVAHGIEKDKKRRNGKIRFALPVRIGEYSLVCPSMDEVINILEGEK